MNLFIRFLFVLLKNVIAPKRKDIFSVGEVSLRVWINDLDLYRHVNNGRYLSLMDIGRIPLLWGTGLGKTLTKHKMHFVVVGETIAFRKSLKLNMKYRIHSRILGFDDRSVYIEQRFLVKNEIYARGIVRMKLVKYSGGTVDIAGLSKIMGIDLSAHPIPQKIADWNNINHLPPSSVLTESEW